ncbi:hypothetical protein PR048_011050 [Dryococelus australis]|uniref:RNA-directed DNA polymerase n=1 Tax=Dryococelus australis TaxID=614101 RepID=A0ABQ9HKH5_9NEOP|nr:hypothetical protein PR048_011050 [Dryococelus australis]
MQMQMQMHFHISQSQGTRGSGILFNDEPPELLLTHNEVRGAQYNDSVLTKVIGWEKQGWPKMVAEPSIRPYFRIREELSLMNNCLTCGNRVVVLDLLHDQHTGIVRMKMLARSSVWWPTMDNDICEKLQVCEACQCTQNRVHANFLLVCDHYSKWVNAWIMSSTIASKVIEKLRSSFSIFGILSTLITDNGPPLNSDEFMKFCKGNGIQVLKSPPYQPQSNGLAEGVDDKACPTKTCN